ncbi:hypothetical protein L596_000033 [Steinernema carpocapsae]|nr:hypothetical protein L596_000033 [Steinernema carpocapsae]
MFPIPETPKFLFIVKGDKEAAAKSIKFFQGQYADVDSVLEEIAKEAEDDAETSSLKEIFFTPYLRKAVMLGCFTLQNTVPLWSILLSSTHFLKQINLDDSVAEWSSTAMALTYTIGTLLGAVCIERFGRRIMLISFCFLNAMSLIVYCVLYGIHTFAAWAKYGCLACFLLYGFTYGCGVGPIAWFLSSELVPQRHRSMVQAICYAINTIVVVITTFTILLYTTPLTPTRLFRFI